MDKMIGVIIVLLLLAGGLYFFISSSDNGDDSTSETAGVEENDSTDSEAEEPTKEEATEETTEQQEEESSEESTEETSGEDENADQESAAEESTTEASTEEPPEEENGASDDESSADTNDYTAAEQCIMSQLTECDDVSTSAQFQAYKDLVADGTLPQAPGSGCLPCAVKYSFEEKYGESRDIEAQPSEEPADDESYTGSPTSLVSTYLFSLPEYYNGANDRTLDYLLPDSNAYNKLTANKASGDFRDHMTYSTYIETVEQMSETRYSVYAYREYSHENSGGVYEAYVRYNVVQQDGQYYIEDYNEIQNVPVQ